MKSYPKIIDPEFLLEDHRAAQIKPTANKSFLYLIATAFSLLLMLVMIGISKLNPEVVNEFLAQIPWVDLKISKSLLSECQFPSRTTVTIFTANFIYLAFMFLDLLRKDTINYDGSKDLFKEASSVSYSLHIAVLIFLLFSIMFHSQPKPKVQVTRIQFIQTQVESKRKPPEKTRRKAPKQSIDSGKHNPKQPVRPAEAKSGEPLPPSPSSKPSQPKPPTAQPKATQTSAAPTKTNEPITPKPLNPAPASAPSPLPKAIAPKPKIAATGLNPMQDPLSEGKNLPKPLNYGSTSSNLNSNASGSGTAPSPKGSLAASSGSGRTGSLVSSLSSIPRAPDGGGGQAGSRGTSANPPPNSNPNLAPSVAAKPDVDYAPYIASVERKIKMNWHTPRGTENSRIVIHFRINGDGSVSDLRIVSKASDDAANQAAMTAVRNSSPFIPPPAAISPVDIDFKFDYNVFQSIRR